MVCHRQLGCDKFKGVDTTQRARELGGVVGWFRHQITPPHPSDQIQGV